MPPGASILLQDTCALIDLLALDLMGCIQESGRSIHISEYVYAEVLLAHQTARIDALILEGLIIVDKFPTDASIDEFMTRFTGLSVADCSMIDLSQRVGGVVVTTDEKLKRVCLSMGLEVHGVVWIIDVMVTERLIDVAAAMTRLDRYVEVNKRAPRQLIEELKQKLRTT
jgi:predicted nucleic acid-binding protein